MLGLLLLRCYNAGLELDLRFCDGKLDCFFCWSDSPYLPWTPFWAVSGRDPPKRGPPPHQLRPLPFSMCWTPFWAVSGRDPPKRGPPPHQLRPWPFSRCWTPFWAVSGRDPPKRGPPPHSSDLYLFPAGEPWAAEILQKGGHRHISSDLDLFPVLGPLQTLTFFAGPAVSGRDPPQRGASTWRQPRCHFALFSGFATYRGCTTVSSLGSCPLLLVSVWKRGPAVDKEMPISKRSSPVSNHRSGIVVAQ